MSAAPSSAVPLAHVAPLEPHGPNFIDQALATIDVAGASSFPELFTATRTLTGKSVAQTENCA